MVNFLNNPKITDTIEIKILTPNASGCFTSNPYKVDNITVFYVGKSYISNNFGEFEKVIYDEKLLDELKEAEKEACEDPSDENLFAVEQLRLELENKANRSTYYYNDVEAVLSLGTENEPAWLSTDEDNALIENVPEDDDGNIQYGVFKYDWNPEGRIREGDFFVCWTWTPMPAGESLSDNISFLVSGDPKALTTIPTHITPDDKYEILLEKYLPEVYKTYLSDSDLTPNVTFKLNKSIGKAFKFVEDFVLQLIDLYDANVLHESLLIYLANLFNLKLKSGDTTLWRRQIKEAIPLFKKKGTLPGLIMALEQAGMHLEKFTKLWQVVSPYTWQESFVVVDSPTFKLQKNIILPIDENNFRLWIRREGSDEYIELNKSYVLFTSDDCGLYSFMTWIGDELSSEPLQIFSGDIIRVLYQYKKINNTSDQTVENYLRTLPLADDSDEFDKEYPKKNWNVRLIEEDDVLFTSIVKDKHPFHEDVIFGQIRTEFPYSENIYNMEEYNGSIRDSSDPCFIDKFFIDPCGSCISSKFNLDVSIENLGDERIEELSDVIRENVPFHAVLNQLNIKGEINEFIEPPVETISMLVKNEINENIIAGELNEYFTRVIPHGLIENKILRNELAEEELIGEYSGTVYNDNIYFILPEVDLTDLGILNNNHYLEVLAPSINSGTYSLKEYNNNIAKLVDYPSELLDESSFNCNLVNVHYSTTNANIIQDNIYYFYDDEYNYIEYSVKTQWDVDNGDATVPWKILIEDYSSEPYVINRIIDGEFILENHDNSLPNSNVSGITYILYDENGEEVIINDNGSIVVENRGLVNLNDDYIEDINYYVKLNYVLYYNGNEYNIESIFDDNIYINEYSDGNATGVSIEIRNYLISQKIGYFSYQGISLVGAINHEVDLGILNGTNPPVDLDEVTDNNLFKENFLVKIGENLYKISEIDGSNLILDGLLQNWGTEIYGGTVVDYEIYKYIKSPVQIDYIIFDKVDRGNREEVIEEILYEDETFEISALSLDSGMSEFVSTEENISFTINYKDETVEEGTI